MHVQPPLPTRVPEHVLHAQEIASKIVAHVQLKSRFRLSINETMMVHTRISHTIVSMLHELKGVKR
jgi:hypothetical protein